MLDLTKGLICGFAILICGILDVIYDQLLNNVTCMIPSNNTVRLDAICISEAYRWWSIMDCSGSARTEAAYAWQRWVQDTWSA